MAKKKQKSQGAKCQGAKNEHGLTAKQELFCQYVVDEYSIDLKGNLTAAYEKAYKCKSDSKKETHWSAASKLMKNPKVATRVEQLRLKQAERAEKKREDIIDWLSRILDLDPMEVKRKLDEMPRRIRLLLDPARKGGFPDKMEAVKRLVDIMGYAKPTEVNIHNHNMGDDVMVGFDTDE